MGNGNREIVSNITKRKRVEEALRCYDQRVEAFLRVISEARGAK